VRKKKSQKRKKSFKTLAVIISLLIICIFILTYSHYLHQKNNNFLQSLSFSTTAVWGEHLLTEMDKLKASKNYEETEYEIPLPPKNSSEETEYEITYLLALQENRTPEKNREIIQEQFIYGMFFNDKPLTDYFNKQKYSFAEDFEKEFWEISTIVLIEKQKFDRVRPHILEPKIIPVIEVPPHPAYPSGHATQAYFAANYLSEKFPKFKDQYFKDAQRITHNREIAGVHYPSDSEAGRLLAEKFFETSN